MNKIEVIARRILGWKLNRWDRWHDPETGTFIYDHEFQPEQNLDHAMVIVNKLKQFGFSYFQQGDAEVCFNEICATGHTLPEAITNAAYEIADNSGIPEGWL